MINLNILDYNTSSMGCEGTQGYFFLIQQTTEAKEKQTLRSFWLEANNLLTVLSFHKHFTANSLQKKILAVPFFLPLCIPYLLIRGDDCLSSSCPSVRLGWYALLAWSSPHSDWPEHTEGLHPGANTRAEHTVHTQSFNSDKHFLFYVRAAL